jgi:large subunit ribosomal protein L6
MVVGVSDGFKKELVITGVGYRAAVENNTLTLQMGYSHPVVIKAEEGLTIECPKPTEIVVSGIDKQRVGELSANIRAVRKPEPYKGKGIAYKGEHIRRKEGKTAASSK